MEEDLNKSVQDVILACKEITKVLPLDFYAEILFDDPNLIIYLLLV